LVGAIALLLTHPRNQLEIYRQEDFVRVLASDDVFGVFAPPPKPRPWQLVVRDGLRGLEDDARDRDARAAAAEAARRADARAAALAAAEAMRALRRREGRRAGLAPDPAAAAAATTAEARAAAALDAARAAERRADELDADAARRAADDARALLMRLARKGRPIDPVLRDGRAARIEASAGDLKRARAQAGKLVRRRERAAARKALAAARPPDADAPRYLPPRD